jgi:hypothetical protein
MCGGFIVVASLDRSVGRLVVSGRLGLDGSDDRVGREW